ncbi:MAG: hypothetical protein AB7S78_10900 [Candidatus Omnitrophota bacterium]
MNNKLILISLCIIWLSAVCTGMASLYNYVNEPSEPGIVVRQRPASIQADEQIFQLVMTAHPHCPCTRASISELDRLMAQTQGKLKARVFFQKPEGFSENWVKADLWKTAERIPGVEVVIDEDGNQSRSLGATTSGQAFLFDPAGKLVFHGGITAARGHEGDNLGHSTIVALVSGEKPDVGQTPAFGCLLRHQP